ncbi:uncharacterized protein LOC144924129 [Branchiostoma floridae x Branchiostoma belcheri]
MEESADGEGGGTKPPSVVPRYLTVGDHVLAFSEHELEDTGDYEEPEKVKAGHVEDSSPSPNYEKPEDVHGYIEVEEEESPPSNDYETPEDVHGYKDEGFYENPENIYGYKVFKAKARLMEMFIELKSGKNRWLLLGCSLLAIVSVVVMAILAPRLIHDFKVG